MRPRTIGWIEPGGRLRAIDKLSTPVLTNKLVTLWNSVEATKVFPYNVSKEISHHNKTQDMVRAMLEEAKRRPDLLKHQRKQLRRINGLLRRQNDSKDV